ncbi:MAG: MinD/ParA family protein [Firmicutes bacterium]|nr:MinD/ParA family protein [Bacillota bacterium]
MSDQAQSLREIVKKAESGAKRVMKRPPTTSKVVSITSGKGGVGKSFLTVNLALALEQLGLHVLVIDADFGLANVDVMLGMPARYNLSHLLSHKHTMEEIVQEWQGGIKFISGGNGIDELLNMNEEQLTKTINEVLLFNEPLDIILCDTGAGVNETVLRLAAVSTEIILVTTPEPTAILDAYALLKTLNQNNDTPKIRLVMNKAMSQKEAENATNSFLDITKKYLDKQIEPLGSILFDNEVGKSIKQQKPLLISQPQNAIVKNIYAIAETLIDLPTEKKPSGQLAQLFSRWLHQA